jgi:hypothetical protein
LIGINGACDLHEQDIIEEPDAVLFIK